MPAAATDRSCVATSAWRRAPIATNVLRDRSGAETRAEPRTPACATRAATPSSRCAGTVSVCAVWVSRAAGQRASTPGPTRTTAGAATERAAVRRRAARRATAWRSARARGRPAGQHASTPPSTRSTAGRVKNAASPARSAWRACAARLTRLATARNVRAPVSATSSIRQRAATRTAAESAATHHSSVGPSASRRGVTDLRMSASQERDGRCQSP